MKIMNNYIHEQSPSHILILLLLQYVYVLQLIQQVGYELIDNSEDMILKQDMPPALQRVEEASILLLQASDMLRVDPYSAPARKKLIEGSRG